jgi:membrane protein YdbS with pleckstrin-like domain
MQPDRENLDPRYITLMRQTGGLWSIGLSVVWGAIIAGVILFTELRDEFHTPLVILWAVLTIAHAWWGQVRPGLHYRHASFHVDDEQIEIHRGFLVRRVINIPRSRVQHTDVSQGPFERRHGLGTLHIYTAGVSLAMIPLAGLEHGRAMAIRDLLLPRERPAPH